MERSDRLLLGFCMAELVTGGAALTGATTAWPWPWPRALFIAVAVAGAVLAVVCWLAEFGWPWRQPPAPTLDEIRREAAQAAGVAAAEPEGRFRDIPAGALDAGLPEMLRGHLDPAHGHGGMWTAEAERVARALLIRHLSDEQRRSFGNHGYFTVTLPEAWRPDFWYRRWRVPGLYGLAASPLGEDGTALPFALCVGPRVVQPESDTLLSTKLMLEHDPGRFLRVGLVHARR